MSIIKGSISGLPRVTIRAKQEKEQQKICSIAMDVPSTPEDAMAVFDGVEATKEQRKLWAAVKKATQDVMDAMDGKRVTFTACARTPEDGAERPFISVSVSAHE